MILRNIFRKFVKLLIVIGAAAALFLVTVVSEDEICNIKNYIFKKSQEAEVKIPELRGPKIESYRWEYAGSRYEITETLYQSTYEYYKSRPKEYKYMEELPDNWKEEYFNMFTKEAKGDDIFLKIAEDIQTEGIKNNLSSDQIVELTVAFVQSIPYDEERAKSILADGNSQTPNYPYEVLYERKGICSDKSFLAAALLDKLGYGVAIFDYETEKHMAAGVKCPQKYSAYNSGYCYVETTSPGNKIGMIPDLEAGTNRTAAMEELSYFNEDLSENTRLKKLGEVEIFLKSDGKTYNGIVKTFETLEEINSLKQDIFSESGRLTNLAKHLKTYQDKLEKMAKKLEKLKADNNYDGYNQLVPEYNNLAFLYKQKVNEYNRGVDVYNQKVERYNKLVREFY